MSDTGNTILSMEAMMAAYDAAAKELLAEKQFLARIMKKFVPEYKEIPLDEIENRYIEPDSIAIGSQGVEKNTTNIEGLSQEDSSINEGTVCFDIIFRAAYPKGDKQIGLYINLEVQNDYYPGYPIETRGVFYAARKLGAQLRHISRDTDYSTLSKVYSVWLCVGNPPKKEANTATLYCMEKRDIIGTVTKDPAIYDMINVIVVRTREDVPSSNNTLELLRVLFSKGLPKAEKINQLENHNIVVNRHMKGKVDQMGDSLGAAIAREAEMRGIRIGEKQGAHNANVQTATNLLSNGLSPELIAQSIPSLSLDFLNELKERLQKKASVSAAKER